MPQPALLVVFENHRVFAVDKPAGQAVIPGRGLPEEPLQAQVCRHLGGKAYVVHRIDRDASGLVVFAKDAATHRDLCLLFEQRQLRKLYLALAQGGVARDGCVESPLREYGSGRSGVAEAGKASLTRYRIMSQARGAALLEVAPLTGRRHQIRVHLHSLGHPILGDRLYGKDRPVGGVERLMLHAWNLSFRMDNGHYRLWAPPGADFSRVLERFGITCPVPGPLSS
ncbi:MAG TPA: RluA family pseudouridine synthase [Elusimicrobia bacterium]|nr:RluA family pseudouridine synthase [Elusimicrobiota bacterium]HBT62400.1 RluA family pseudouridine synthase [Elusimicrobiota bacterium]